MNNLEKLMFAYIDMEKIDEAKKVARKLISDDLQKIKELKKTKISKQNKSEIRKLMSDLVFLYDPQEESRR